jgi:hypothetical protein
MLGNMKSDEVKTTSMSGLACMALWKAASARSWFHSVGMRATTSISPCASAIAASNPSLRPIAFTSLRSPSRIAALAFRPDRRT